MSGLPLAGLSCDSYRAQHLMPVKCLSPNDSQGWPSVTVMHCIMRHRYRESTQY